VTASKYVGLSLFTNQPGEPAAWEIGGNVVEDLRRPLVTQQPAHWPSALRVSMGKRQNQLCGLLLFVSSRLFWTALISRGILSSVKMASACPNFSLSLLLSCCSRATSPQFQ
jgi:hypothetical protein